MILSNAERMRLALGAALGNALALCYTGEPNEIPHTLVELASSES